MASWSKKMHAWCNCV